MAPARLKAIIESNKWLRPIIATVIITALGMLVSLWVKDVSRAEALTVTMKAAEVREIARAECAWPNDSSGVHRELATAIKGIERLEDKIDQGQIETTKRLDRLLLRR